MAMQMEVTVTEVTVDQLYEDLSKLRVAGLGAYAIEWHTSRSHLGKSITMALQEVPAARAKSAGAGGGGGGGTTAPK